MSDFPSKQFEGKLYAFQHLQPMQLEVPLNRDRSLTIGMHVTFGCHCFTEEFDETVHGPGHSYTHRHETRAFDPLRYKCSLQLPQLLQSLISGTIYRAEESYTYAAHITLENDGVKHGYSIFFSLKKDKKSKAPAVRMFVKSAYLKPLVAKPNAQNWRFASLAGEISKAFPPKEKKPKPERKKKKAPQGPLSTS